MDITSIFARYSEHILHATTTNLWTQSRTKSKNGSKEHWIQPTLTGVGWNWEG